MLKLYHRFPNRWETVLFFVPSFTLLVLFKNKISKIQRPSLYIVMVAVAIVSFSSCSNGTASGPDTSKETERDTSVIAATPQGIEALNEQIKKAPNNPELYNQRAMAYFSGGDAAMALNDFDRSLQIDSTQSSVYFEKAKIYWGQLQSVDARKMLTKSLQFDPANMDALLLKAQILITLEKYMESFEPINEALKLDVHLPEGYFLKGLAYRKLGDTALALSSYMTAIEQNPDYFDAYMETGFIFDALNDPLAEGYYTNALKIRPTDIQALYNRSFFLQRNQAYQAALQGYEAILNLDTAYFDAHFNMGVTYLLAQDPELAKGAFRKAMQLRPIDPRTHYFLGYAHELNGEAKVAEQYFRSALKLKPDYDEPALGLSRVLGEN